MNPHTHHPVWTAGASTDLELGNRYNKPSEAEGEWSSTFFPPLLNKIPARNKYSNNCHLNFLENQVLTSRVSIYTWSGIFTIFTIIFPTSVLEAKTNSGHAALRLLNSTRKMLHYIHPNHPVGDVHPYFENGVYYLNYIHDPGKWIVDQLRSTDLLHWEWYPLSHTPPASWQILPNWYVLSTIRDPVADLYRTYYFHYGSRMSVSQDLQNWEFGTPHQILPSYDFRYSRQGDNYAFYNEELKEYWMVILLQRNNVPYYQAGAIGYATSENLVEWKWKGELYYPGNKGDPEVPSMFNVGTKWYLLTSFYDHMVGKPSYRISETPYGPWSVPVPDSLDGKDLCAAMTVSNGLKRLLLGWIPLTASKPDNQHWGGHIAFPREVYQLSDGRLACRLESSIGSRIRGEQLFPGGTTVISQESGLWNIDLNSATCTSTIGYAFSQISTTYDELDLDLSISLGDTCKRAGVLLGRNASLAGFEISIDMEQGRFVIWSPGTWVHSEIQLHDFEPGVHSLRVIIEEDIVEAFLDDQYSLAARLPSKLNQYKVGLFSFNGTARFDDIRLFRLKGLEEISEAESSVDNWSQY
ncbi:MAG: hypothetical protein UZ16_OP3001000476 [Candidatus Hinthialibacteria bacterium OLB16]|nr:MAG: hypothetical protein UZ16_OP3001000476 [Candidatus Hinthialibacteria bacterium OLB16]